MFRRLLAALLLCVAVSAQVSHWSAQLDGDHVVPATSSRNSAWGLVRLDAATNLVQVFVATPGALAATTTAVVVRQGSTSQSGPVVLALAQASQQGWRGNANLTSAQVTALVNQGLYLEVQTIAQPTGEVRGQIERPRTGRFAAALSGQQVSPPTVSAASGTCIAFLHEPENRLVFAIETNGVPSWTAAHLHIGAPGTNGPITAVPLGIAERWRGVSERLSDADVAALRAGQWYVDVHSTQFPNGELRGQLRPDPGSHWIARCIGNEETPPNASTATCTAELTVLPDDSVVLTGTYAGITPISAHVHTGPIGTAGPILFGLNLQNGELSGSFRATVTELANLRAGFWYVNLHSNTFPQGEVRGQLAASPLPTSFGEGCRTSDGQLPFGDVTDLPAIGSPLALQVVGATCCGFTLLCLGDDRTTGVPISLRAVGLDAVDCFALTNVFSTDLRRVDRMGGSDAALPVPYDTFLRGASIHAQWVLLDPLANPAGLVVSNAATFTIL